MKVYLAPAFNQVNQATGIGRVVHAQYKYLPDYGVELVNNLRQTDITAVHTQSFEIPNPDVVMIHGLYWTGDPGSGIYSTWNNSINTRLVDAMRKARVITVPSQWVAEPIKCDMRIRPRVIGHGIDFDDWQPGVNAGYVLWNKNRPTDVCDPTPAWELAMAGIRVLSTYAPIGKVSPDSMIITGRLPAQDMKIVIANADVYLATTKETFGIGTLEAMACGVPVLGYDWGGTSDLIAHKVTGWLAKPGDIEGLIEGYDYIRAHRAEMGETAREVARTYTWPAMIAKYAELFHEMLTLEPSGVAIVITNHNYAAFVDQAIQSALQQSCPVDEIIVVDDGSTDDSSELLQKYTNNPKVRLIFQENLGVAAARNNAIKATQQPFIISLDADDMLDPRFVKACWDALTADRSLGIAYTGINILHYDGKQSLAGWPPQFDWKIQSTVTNPPGNCISSACMFRRSMWERAGGYRQAYAPGEDAEFWTRGLSVGFTAKKVTPEPLFIYRVHKDSESRTKRYHEIDAWLPWMRDRQYPIAAPAKTAPLVRSYSEPDISVIIPVGPGHETAVYAALDCLVGQTYRNWEALVINDTGKPMELPTCYMWAKVIETGGTVGSGAARNIGLKAAKAPVICFLDADDYLLPTALSNMLDLFVASNGRYVYTDWQTESGEIHETPEYDAKDFTQSLPHAVTTLIAAEDAIGVGGFDEALSSWEDWDFYLRCALSQINGIRLHKPLLVYDTQNGRRRKLALKTEKALRKKILKRYEGVEMSPCCGGGQAASQILKAKRNLPPMGGYQEAVEMKEIPTTDQGKIRIEYIGKREGSVTYFGKRLHYRFGNNALDRVHDVEPEDAEKLLGAEDFRIVPINSASGPAGFIPAPEKQAEPLAEVAVKEAKPDDVTDPNAEVVPSPTIEADAAPKPKRKAKAK